MFFKTLITVCLLIQSIDGLVSENAVINTKLGKILGNVKTIKNQKVYEFLGIQYGNSPVGNLRFRPSTLNTSWGNATYNGTTFGKMCMQQGVPNYTMVSENCLFLNIWTTSIESNANLPVMFWIHGGGFHTGSGSASSFIGVNFTSISENIVYVSINYRLGALGFLASQQLVDEDKNWPSTGGFNGINDQIMALKWVKNYISDFGGDPNQVTIFGESAGGMSICSLVISSLIANDNLFQHAIQQSGSCTGAWGPMNKQTGLQKTITNLQNANMSTNITELRLLPAYDFISIGNSFSYSVDGLVLTELPTQIYANLHKNKLNVDNLIMGYVAQDGYIGFPDMGGPYPNTPAEYTTYLKAYGFSQQQINDIETIYYPLSDFPAYNGHTSSAIAWFSMNGDVCVACPTLQEMDLITSQLSSNSFSGYVFEFRGPKPWYAGHGCEIPFIFDHESESNWCQVPWNQSLSNSMLFSWSNYGKYGIPNITNNINNYNIIWNKYDDTSNSVLILDDNIRIESNYFKTFRNGACPFWFNTVGIGTMQSLCWDWYYG